MQIVPLEQPQTRHDFQNAVVLVVDDDRATLSALTRVLRNEPYEVIAADSAERALECIDAVPVSLVVTDEFMPYMRGTQLLAEIQKRSPATGTAILTARPDPQLMTRSWVLGVDAFLCKPWDDTALRETLTRLLGERGFGVRGVSDVDPDYDVGGEGG